MVLICGTVLQSVSAKNLDSLEEIQADTKLSFISPDVPADAWFRENLENLCEKCPNILMGMSDDPFSPESDVTRAESIVMLYRMAGRPSVQDSAASAGRWYDKALSWAQDAGIMLGCGEDDLAADSALTREQLAVILYRYAQLQGKADFCFSSRSLADFYDSWRISPWASGAMQWAVSSGIIQGNGNSLLRPTDNTTQAEIISALSRYLADDMTNGKEKTIQGTEPIFLPKFITVESTQLIDAP